MATSTEIEVVDVTCIPCTPTAERVQACALLRRAGWSQAAALIEEEPAQADAYGERLRTCARLRVAGWWQAATLLERDADMHERGYWFKHTMVPQGLAYFATEVRHAPAWKCRGCTGSGDRHVNWCPYWYIGY